ncbi:hypothetical protein P4E94_03460 [Pontiellaceae bacterium B12219]|nr:hypothetical protein [Pontiellaceae bacterium B12219]
MKYFKQKVLISSLLATGMAFGGVDHWEFITGEMYEQSVDDTAPSGTPEMFIYSYLELEQLADATAIRLEGGNLSLPLNYEQSDDVETEWDLFAQYATPTAFYADFPSNGTARIILEGPGGSLTQEVSLAVGNYPEVPYLTGNNLSAMADLDVNHPAQTVTWNDPQHPDVLIAFQQYVGSVTNEELFYDDFDAYEYTSFDWPELDVDTQTDYIGLIEFSGGVDVAVGGFGVEGYRGFSRLTEFPILYADHSLAGDSFDDNSLDESKWAEFIADSGTQFTETNMRLEYSNDGGGEDQSMAWEWIGSELSATNSWSVEVEAAQFLNQGSFGEEDELWMGMILMVDGDLDNHFGIEINTSHWNTELKTFARTNDTDVVDGRVVTIENEMTLKLSYDAESQFLSSSYGIDGVYVNFTNLLLSAVNGTAGSSFSPILFTGQENVGVSSGEVYFDDFLIYEGKAPDDYISKMEMEFKTSYGDPDDSGDDEASLNISLNASSDVDFIWARPPVGEIDFEVEEYLIDGDITNWKLESYVDLSDPWNSDWDGTWLITVGLSDGTLVSTELPFIQTDGVTAIPEISGLPFFTDPVGLNGSFSSNEQITVTWNEPDADASVISLSLYSEEYDEDYDIGFFGDSIDDPVGWLPPFEGPLSTRTAGPITLSPGGNWLELLYGWGRTAENDDGIIYLVAKIAESETYIQRPNAGDDDNDGLPDVWEQDFFGGTDAVNGGPQDDWDGDEMDNLSEYIAGTVPTNSASVFKIESMDQIPEGFVIHWNAVAGREYEIMVKEDLSVELPYSAGTLYYPQNSYTNYYPWEENKFYFLKVKISE